jgi:hypothetical protein
MNALLGAMVHEQEAKCRIAPETITAALLAREYVARCSPFAYNIIQHYLSELMGYKDNIRNIENNDEREE